jgi:hypothetical protein
MRGKSTGASSLDEILDALKRGGFDFPGQGWSDSGRWKNQLSIAISKNLNIFHRLPNDSIGLLAWYPDAAAKRGKAKDGDKASEDGEKKPDGGTGAASPKAEPTAKSSGSGASESSPDDSAEDGDDAGTLTASAGQ